MSNLKILISDERISLRRNAQGEHVPIVNRLVQEIETWHTIGRLILANTKPTPDLKGYSISKSYIKTLERKVDSLYRSPDDDDKTPNTY